MAVTITSPQSAVVARGAFTLAWTHDYPQARYEVLYRKKGENAWQTFGQVASTATNITVNCNVFDDFVEYQYRVIVYSEYAEGTETTYSGNDASAAYAVVVVPASQVGTMKAKYGDSMIEVPLYTTLQQGKEKISVQGNTTNLSSTNTLSDQQSQQFSSGIKANDGSSSYPVPKGPTADDLSYTGEVAYHYMVARSAYYTYYYLPAYYNYIAPIYSEYYGYYAYGTGKYYQYYYLQNIGRAYIQFYRNGQWTDGYAGENFYFYFYDRYEYHYKWYKGQLMWYYNYYSSILGIEIKSDFVMFWHAQNDMHAGFSSYVSSNYWGKNLRGSGSLNPEANKYTRYLYAWSFAYPINFSWNSAPQIYSYNPYYIGSYIITPAYYEYIPGIEYTSVYYYYNNL